MDNFPSQPDNGKSVTPVSPPDLTVNSKKQKALSRVSETGPAGQLPPHILYLIDLGMNLEQIKGITSRFPAFCLLQLGGKN